MGKGKRAKAIAFARLFQRNEKNPKIQTVPRFLRPQTSERVCGRKAKEFPS